jgi:hypothetical protein
MSERDEHDDEDDAPQEAASFLSLWMETRGTHTCELFMAALTDAVYDVMRYRHRRKDFLAVVPNIADTEFWTNTTISQDRVRYCPYCGKKVKAVRAPRRLRGKMEVPDHLPDDL